MILWYLDRFGLPGTYRSVWTKLLTDSKISPLQVRTVSLHKDLGGTLLIKHGNRKAPTWNPMRETEIRSKISRDIELHRPDVIVLSAPESLCVTDLHPDEATLLKVRGSVYNVQGIPALVTLPMSAWSLQVSSKDIGQANYGEVDAETFDESHSETPDTVEGDDASEDRFWYEPVIVPVGKFMLIADTRKLGRLHRGEAGVIFNAY